MRVGEIFRIPSSFLFLSLRACCILYMIWVDLWAPFFSLYMIYFCVLPIKKKNIYIYIYLRLSREDSLVASRLRVEGKKEYMFLTYCLQMILSLLCGQHKSIEILEMDPNMF